MTTPLPHIIKEADPEAFVGFITQGPSDQLLLNNPNVDKVFVYKPKEGLSGQLRLMREVRKYGFEVALDTNGTPGTELFALFSGAKTRAGFRSGRRSFTYTHRIARGGGYVVEVKKSLLRAIGIKSSWDRPEIFLDAGEKERANG
ncbi:glycosyltransferase family 9 protein, partial [bacterium]